MEDKYNGTHVPSSEFEKFRGGIIDVGENEFIAPRTGAYYIDGVKYDLNEGDIVRVDENDVIYITPQSPSR